MQKTAKDRKAYKAAWYLQNKLKRPEDKKVFDLENRKYLRKSGIYKISWDNCKYYYFGQSDNLQKRFVCHLAELRKNVHSNIKLQNVFNKYGKPKFSVFMLCELCELDKIEQAIVTEHAKDRFNCNIRVEDIKTNRGVFWSKERREKIRKNKINNGTSKLIYVYNKETGELINKAQGIVYLTESLGLKKEKCAAICGVLRGTLKTAYGMYFSYQEKTKEEVLDFLIPETITNKVKLREERSKRMSGINNPMYGKKRPENSGKNHAFVKMIENGYTDHRKSKKVLISIQEIINLDNQGLSAKQIAEVAGCGYANINLLLRQNDIHKGKGFNKKRKIPTNIE